MTGDLGTQWGSWTASIAVRGTFMMKVGVEG